jgi:hypothetical protein
MAEAGQSMIDNGSSGSFRRVYSYMSPFLFLVVFVFFRWK